jgi:hypothetical protein
MHTTTFVRFLHKARQEWTARMEVLLMMREGRERGERTQVPGTYHARIAVNEKVEEY